LVLQAAAGVKVGGDDWNKGGQEWAEHAAKLGLHGLHGEDAKDVSLI
jgi:hypothetical protein